MTWGRTDLTGTTVYNFGSNITGVLMLDRTAPYVAPSNRNLTRIDFYARDNLAPAFQVGFQLYDVTDGVVDAPMIWSQFFELPVAASPQWVQFTPATPPALVAGRSYVRAFTRGQSGQNAEAHRIAAATNFGGIYTKSNETTPPNPSGTASSAHNFDYALQYITTPTSPQIDSVNGGTDTARIGDSVPVEVSNFTDPVNAGTIDTVPLAAASSTSITLPAFAPGALVPRVGASRDLVLTRDAQSASRNITVQAPYVPDVLVEGNPVAYEYVTAEEGFNTGANDSIVFEFDPPMATGRQIFYDPTKGYVTPQMQYVGDYIGEQIMWDYDPDTRIIRQFTVITSQEDTGIRVKLKRPLKRSLKRRL